MVSQVQSPVDETMPSYEDSGNAQVSSFPRIHGRGEEKRPRTGPSWRK